MKNEVIDLPNGVKIIQIIPVVEKNTTKVLGLGNDNGIYLWHGGDTWKLTK